MGGAARGRDRARRGGAAGVARAVQRRRGRRLLGDASLVRRVCAALPRVLDVAPDSKADAKVLESSWALWRGVRFALTFESDMVAHDGGERLFITEKSLKPMEHGLPFVMLGSPGTLAVLRALGFRSFAPAINESYDEILDGAERLRAALAEAARLAEMGDEAWSALVSGGEVAAALRHNLRHMHCGGLKRTMADLALSVVDGALVVPPARRRRRRRRRRRGGSVGSAGGSSGGRSRGCTVIGLSSWLKPGASAHARESFWIRCSCDNRRSCVQGFTREAGHPAGLPLVPRQTPHGARALNLSCGHRLPADTINVSRPRRSNKRRAQRCPASTR